VLGLSLGAAAVSALSRGEGEVMVALRPPQVECVPLAQAVAKMKPVPVNGDGVLTARALDVCLGD
jgi:6-phosphofructokinase 1